jgi:CubicO group peptidase (beta-lactamase class C family)
MKKVSCLILLIAGMMANAQSWQDTVNKLDGIMRMYKDSSPGAQFAISRNGKIIYNAARGLASLEHQAPLTTTSKIEAGSVSKQFTAAAILLLEQQGKLSVNDDIRKYLPELPDFGHVIRIYHLLHHTSGLKDWGSVIALSGWPRGTRAYNNDDAYHIMCNQPTLNNIPGDEYIYSNSNYTALTTIVARVSGMSHAAFTKKYIFDPAGMKNTEWRDDYKRVVAGRAIAYEKNGKVYETDMPNEDTYGHGALLTTTEDLLLWNNFYLSGKFGSPSLFAKQTETRLLNNGKKNNYAAGLNTANINGHRAISHTGATASYRAQLEFFPGSGLSFAWLSNTSESETAIVPDSMRNLFVKNLVPASDITEPAATNIDWKKFNVYKGAYRSEKFGTGFTLYSKEDGMYLVPNGGPLEVKGNNILGAGRSQLIFPVTGKQNVTFISAQGDTILFTATDTAAKDEISLREYTGTYFSDATESYMYVEYKNNRLQMYPRKGGEVGLIGTHKDGFYRPGAEIWFERDKDKKITRLFINVSRARKVEFRKVK